MNTVYKRDNETERERETRVCESLTVEVHIGNDFLLSTGSLFHDRFPLAICAGEGGVEPVQSCNTRDGQVTFRLLFLNPRLDPQHCFTSTS